MSLFVYIISLAFAIHAAQSYILLTANLDDLHSIAKELIQSPASDQIGNIIRRAYTEMKKIDLFSNRSFQPRVDYDDEDYRRNIKETDKTQADTEMIEETTETKTVIDQEQPESVKDKEKYFIKSIKKVLDSVK